MSGGERERFEAEIERLQATVNAQAELIEQLRSKIAELEARLGQDSASSSAPPSRDLTDRRARRAAERAERKDVISGGKWRTTTIDR